MIFYVREQRREQNSPVLPALFAVKFYNHRVLGLHRFSLQKGVIHVEIYPERKQRELRDWLSATGDRQRHDRNCCLPCRGGRHPGTCADLRQGLRPSRDAVLHGRQSSRRQRRTALRRRRAFRDTALVIVSFRMHSDGRVPSWQLVLLPHLNHTSHQSLQRPYFNYSNIISTRDLISDFITIGAALEDD